MIRKPIQIRKVFDLKGEVTVESYVLLSHVLRKNLVENLNINSQNFI